MSSVISVTNTIAFLFPDNAAQPTLGEMVRFVKGLIGDHGKMDTAYKNAEERSVFIKYKSEEDMREALSCNDEKQTFHYSNGTKVDVCMTVAGGNTQYVRVFDLPPEVTDRDLSITLSKFGKIQRCVREKFPPEYQLDLFTGVRGVYMDVQTDIPSVLYVLNRRGRIFYSGNKLKCFTCGQEGHQKNSCGRKKKNKTTPAAGTEKKEEEKNNTFAAVLAGTSSAGEGTVDLEIEILEEEEEEEDSDTAVAQTPDPAMENERQPNQHQQKQTVLHDQQLKQQQKVGNWTEYVQMHSKLLKQQRKQQKLASENSPPRKSVRPNSPRLGTGSE